MKTYKLTVATPNGNVFEDEVVMLTVRGVAGELAVMAGHIPFVTSVVQGACAVWTDENTKKTATTKGGLLTVDKDAVTFLAGTFKFDE